MPRKVKSVYEKISTTQKKIDKLEQDLKEQKTKLVALNKEKDEHEMHQLFQTARENNMSIDDVIKAINSFNKCKK